MKESLNENVLVSFHKVVLFSYLFFIFDEQA